MQGMHRGFSCPGCPEGGNFTVISWSCLSEAQNKLMRGRTGPPTGENKWKMGCQGADCLAWRGGGGGELL